MSTWLSDPAGMRQTLKAEVVRRLTVQLRDACVPADQQAHAAKTLRAALANITSEEYPTPAEFTEAVEELAARFALQWHP